MKKFSFPLLTFLVVIAAMFLFFLNLPLYNLTISSLIISKAELWRILSGQLAHSNLTHLLTDCGGFLVAGCLIENTVSRRFFVLLILLLSIVASVSVLVIYPGSEACGLSGLVNGLLGTIIARFFLYDRDYLLTFMVFIFAFLKLFLEFLSHSNLSFGLSQLLSGSEILQIEAIGSGVHLIEVISGFLIGAIYYSLFNCTSNKVRD